jgi:hypothetical protein
MTDDDSFDLDAAGLRADGADVGAYVEVLARKLEDALPRETVVKRRSKGFLSREKVVDTIEVTLGDACYTLAHKHGRVETARAKAVRGVVIKREPVDLPAWVGALTADLREMAAGSASAREAFEKFVG